MQKLVNDLDAKKVTMKTKSESKNEKRNKKKMLTKRIKMNNIRRENIKTSRSWSISFHTLTMTLDG